MNSIYISIKKSKSLRNKFIKVVPKLYSENYKALLKEIKEDINELEVIPYSWAGRLNIIKMTLLPKLIHRLDAVLLKNPSQSMR